MFGQFVRASGFMGVVALAAALSACGGGGDSAKLVSNGTTDPYVGNFQSACIQETPTLSYRFKVSVVKKSQTVAEITSSVVAYDSTSCTGTGTPVPGNGGTATATITGTKVVDGKTVDTADVQGPGGADKDIFYTDGSSLFFGEDSGDVDAKGYPVKLDTSGDDTFTRI